jgi:hypothetical protein
LESLGRKGMESIEYSMDPKVKKEYKEEHEDFKERKKRQNNKLLYRES